MLDIERDSVLIQATGTGLRFNLKDAFLDVLLEDVQSHAERSIDGPELDVFIVDIDEPEKAIESSMEDGRAVIDPQAFQLDTVIVDLHADLDTGGTES